MRGCIMDYAVAEEIAALLDNGFDIRVVECTASTNTSLKEMAADGAPSGTVLIARSQHGGRGRMGRSFFSGRGGLYLSVLLRPSVSPAGVGLFTPLAALAVADAVEAVLGKHLLIKWVNDLFYGGKKACGILTEAAVNVSGTGVDYAVIGVGLNVYAPEGGFGDGLEEIATSLLPTATEKSGVINCLAAEIVTRIDAYTKDAESSSLYNAYRDRLFILGKRVTVHRAAQQFDATGLDLNKDYTLLVRDDDGGMHSLLSGEVSVRPEIYE